MQQVTYIDHMGSDARVVDAARASMDKISNTTEVEAADIRLIKYLAKHKHFTPFTHPQITLVYKVPIFVARQEFKHIVGFTRNETSRRYVDTPPEFYEPNSWRSRPEASIKQGSGEALGLTKALGADGILDMLHADARTTYNQLLDMDVAPEQARMVLPQSMLTEYMITGSLAAYARMYQLRADSHAQKEIQDLAHEVAKVIQPLFPHSWAALTT